MSVKFPFAGASALAFLGLMAGCSASPTAPTPTTTGSSMGTVSQEPPPAPPRANPSVAIPGAIGATRFLAFGDSITYGTLSRVLDVLLDGTSQSYPTRLRIGLSTYHPSQSFSVINAGIPGEGAVEGASRISSVLSANRPQALLLLEGINDLNVGRSVGQTVNALETILDHARLYNVTVIIATMFQTYEVGDRLNGAAQVPDLNNGIRQIASGRQNVFLVDINHAFGSNRDYVGADGLHPTEQGYERMASWFMAAIEQAFPVRGTIQ